jgi:hypothetical protein
MNCSIVQHIDRIADPNSLPIDDDVIQCRVRTTGIVELLFELEHINFRYKSSMTKRPPHKMLFCVVPKRYSTRTEI